MSEELQELAIRLLLACVAVTWLVAVLRADKDKRAPNFTLRLLISTKDGYPDRVAIQELGSWIAFTFVLAVLTMRDLLTEWFAGLYVGVFVLRGAYSSFLRATRPPEPEGTVTATTSTTQTRTTEGPK